MSWSAPMTAVANSYFTAAQFNTYVRDNLNQTMPAKASAAGQYFVSTGANTLVARSPVSNTITTTVQDFTTDGDWENVSGGSVSTTTDREALIWVGGWIAIDTADRAGLLSFKVSGATTRTPDDHACRTYWDGVASNNGSRQGCWGRITSLRPGTNTFTLQARTPSSSTTMSLKWAHIIVIPL